jgi:DNA-binding beta-propeller fold protein YncE
MGDCNCKHGASGAGGVCVECDIPQLARNNYFTGKLLVERDFTDEQRYLMGKQRRHNQRLHGWGSVCGLKVKPHPTCPDRYVIIEPGTAIDCCGREILLKAEEYFGFKDKFLENWQKQNGPNSQPDTAEHKIQICVSYKECGAEDIPALFDDCNCDATSCQPNRILESYGFDVLIDPKTTGVDGQNINVNWSCTIGLANVVRVAVNDATNRLYVLTSDKTANPNVATLYAIDATNDSILASQTFTKKLGLDVAVSPGGDFVYVALQPTTSGSDTPQILVMATSDLTTTINTLTAVGANSDPIRLAVAPAPDSRLLAVVRSTNNVLIWKPDINGATPSSPSTVPVGANPVSIAVSDSGLYAYVANSGDGTVSAFPLATLTPVTPVSAGLAGSTPAVVAATSITAGDTVAVLDTTNTKALYLISIPSGGPTAAVQIGNNPVANFNYSPIDVRLSPAGGWAYVLEQDSGTAKGGFIQLVDVSAVQLNAIHVLGTPMPVGLQPVGETLGDDGAHLYVWYNGDGKSIPGGVAILNVVQDGCCDLFKQTIEGCPDCADGNCIVLATINNYIYPNPVAVTDIDNLSDRHLLVSTDLLTQAVQCLCEQRAVSGKPGKDGAPGAPGPGLETGLTRITALSWTHAQLGSPVRISDPKSITGAKSAQGFVIAFTGDVPAKGRLDRHVFEIYAPVPGSFSSLPLNALDIRLPGEVYTVTFKAGQIAGNLVTGATITNTGNAQGVAFIPQDGLQKFWSGGAGVRVYFRGDFVLDTSSRAICCEFVRAEFPTGQIPHGQDFGLEGGLFFSWFEGQGG